MFVSPSFSESDVRAFSASDIKNAPPSSFSLRQAIKDAWNVLRHNFALVLCLTWPLLLLHLEDMSGLFFPILSTLSPMSIMVAAVLLICFSLLSFSLASCNTVQLAVFGPNYFRRPFVASVRPTWAMWKFLGWSVIGYGVPTVFVLFLPLDSLFESFAPLLEHDLNTSETFFLSSAAILFLGVALFVLFPLMARVTFALYGLACGLSFFQGVRFGQGCTGKMIVLMYGYVAVLLLPHMLIFLVTLWGVEPWGLETLISAWEHTEKLMYPEEESLGTFGAFLLTYDFIMGAMITLCFGSAFKQKFMQVQAARGDSSSPQDSSSEAPPLETSAS